MKHIRNWLNSVCLITCLALTGAQAAWAREALAPQEAPDLFFESVYKMDYVQAWQLLTAPSQERIIKLVIETEKDPRLQTATLRKLFETGDRAVQRGFWTQLRQSMDIETWTEQSFTEPRAGEKAGENFVRVMPADIFVFVRQESGGWKFGFVESFVERRRPKGEPGQQQALPDPVPSGPSNQTPGGTKQ